MAELLVKQSDNVNADANKQLRGWKRGDIVVAMPNNTQWGTEEAPPKFCIVKMPAVPAASVSAYLSTISETVEKPTNLPFEIVSLVPAFQARQNGGGQVFITTSRLVTRRSAGINLDALMIAIKNSTIAGTIVTINSVEYVATATLTLVNLAAIRKARPA